jgi:hypothetical protein
MPILAFRREHFVELVLGSVAILRRLDANPSDEAQSVKIGIASRLTCLSGSVAVVVRPDAARAFENRSQP